MLISVDFNPWLLLLFALLAYHPDDFIFTWLPGFNVEDGDDDQHRHQPMITRPAEPLFVTIWSISHIHAPQDCYKIVPCNSNVVDFVIFKLQHLSVFNINRTYTLELDVEIFLLMYKCLFSFYSQEISRQKKNTLYTLCLYKHKLKFMLVNCNSCQFKIFHFSWKCLVDERTVFGQRFFNGRCEHGQVMYSCKEIGTRWSKGFFRELSVNPSKTV